MIKINAKILGRRRVGGKTYAEANPYHEQGLLEMTLQVLKEAEENPTSDSRVAVKKVMERQHKLQRSLVPVAGITPWREQYPAGYAAVLESLLDLYHVLTVPEHIHAEGQAAAELRRLQILEALERAV